MGSAMLRVSSKCKHAVAGILLCSVIGLGCQQQRTQAPAAQTAPGDPVKRGDYLVTVVGCNDCHTPLKMGPNGPEPDMARMLSGHPETMLLPPPPRLPKEGWNWTGAGTTTAFAGPWGITYAANLTPDQNTGLGTWTEDMFIKTLRNGRHMANGRPLNPPMPWRWFAKMTDEDLKAIFAYLRTIPPIQNHVPDYQEPAAAK